jgi:hypothetical protein
MDTFSYTDLIVKMAFELKINPSSTLTLKYGYAKGRTGSRTDLEARVSSRVERFFTPTYKRG